MKEVENILTQSEINFILRDAENAIYKKPNAIFFPIEGKTMILRIGQENNAIMINGNEDTGFTHIKNRHDYYGNKDYWRIMTDDYGKEIVRLEDPSRFSKYSIPLFHYTEIAETILKPENINIDKNKKPKIFDFYSGNYEHRDGVIMSYNLITYKNTPIIHTLFPDKRKYNRKNIINLVRGKVYGKEIIRENVKTIFIPYRDQSLTKYTILIQKKYEIGMEIFLVAKHDNKGEPEKTIKIAERKLNNEVSTQHEMISYQHSDLSNFEKVIKQLMSEVEW